MRLPTAPFYEMKFQASLEVIEKDKGSLWWAGKELMPEKTLEDYVGKNEKTKIVVKLTKVSNFVYYCQLFKHKSYENVGWQQTIIGPKITTIFPSERITSARS